jgi:hypothetical protein
MACKYEGAVKSREDERGTHVEPHALILLAECATLALQKRVSSATSNICSHVAGYKWWWGGWGGAKCDKRSEHNKV